MVSPPFHECPLSLYSSDTWLDEEVAGLLRPRHSLRLSLTDTYLSSIYQMPSFLHPNEAEKPLFKPNVECTSTPKVKPNGK